jgi:hypothetical protein
MSTKEAGMIGWLKSKEIHKAAFEKRIEDYGKNSKKCLHCLTPLSYDKRFGKFCNHTCSAIFNNLKKEKKIKICNYCKENFHSRPKICKFCSKECEIKFKTEQTISKWKTGHVKGYTGKTMQVSSWLRKYLFDKFDSKCHMCGWCEINPTTNKIPLEVNHIDGDASNTVEENLELICPNCHSLTPNFRALNKNSKRNRK